MSTVDERVLEMRFINDQFEKKAAESIKTLEKLNNSLEMGPSAKSLQAIEKNLTSLSEKFTFMGRLGMRVFDNLADSALRAGKNIINSLTSDQINAGFSKYEQKTRAIQTILAATENQGKTLEDVNRVVEKLNKYTDETSYSFTEMISSIGKFTANGIDLEIAEKAMEGIANEAARSGVGIQGANHAMYNFSQALATGAVQLMDWKSIENANMATQEFKETIIQTAKELGTLNKEGKTSKGTLVNFQTFNSTLSEKWFTSDVLIKTLEKYADTTTEFGLKAFHAAQQALTFTDAMDAVKDAVSTNWMKTFEYIFGDLDESIELWTDFCNAIIDLLAPMDEFRNDLLKLWHDLGGRKDLIDGISAAFDGLRGILGVVGKAFESIFPEITVDHLLAISSAIKDLGEGLSSAFPVIEEIEEKVSKSRTIFDETKVAAKDGTSAVLKYAKAISTYKGELKEGDKGLNVVALKKLIWKAGYTSTDFEQNFGKSTTKVLKELQKEMGLTETGVYDLATHMKLLEKSGIDTGFDYITEHTKNATKSMTEFSSVLETGLKGDDVKTLQKNLEKLGYSVGGADGIFGKKTKAGIEAFQKAMNLTVTGVYDLETHTKLLEQINLEKPAKQIERFTRELKKGLKGDDVKALQKNLEKLGYKLGGADGVFGSKTHSAVEQFQKDMGFTVTGVYDLQTSIALTKEVAKKTFKSSDEYIKEFTEDLGKGMKGDQVTLLQKSLEKLGYSVGGVDGAFGKKTHAALKKFQEDVGLAATGVYDLETHLKLVEKLNPFTKKSEDAEDATNEVKEATVAMSNLMRIASGAFAVIDIVGRSLAFVGSVIASVAKTLSPIITMITSLLACFGDLAVSIDDTMKSADPFTGWLEKINNFLAPIEEKLRNAALAFDAFLKNNKVLFTFEGAVKAVNKVIHNMGDIWEKLVKKVKSTEAWHKMRWIILSVRMAFQKFKDTLGVYYKIYSTILGTKIKNNFAKIGDILMNAGAKVGEGFSNFLEWAAPYTEQIPKFIESIGNFFTSIPEKAKPLINAAKPYGEAMKNFFASIPESVSGFVNKIPNFITSIADFFKKLYEQIKGSEKIQKIWSTVKNIFEEIKTTFVGFWESIGNFFGMTKEAGSNGIAKATEKFNQITGFFQGVEKTVGDSGLVLAGTLTQVGDILSGVYQKLGVGGLAALLLAILGIGKLLKVLKVFEKFQKGFDIIVKGIKGEMKPKQIQPWSRSFLEFAAGFLIVAGAMKIIADIPTDGFTRAVSVVGALVGAALIMTFLQKKMPAISKDKIGTTYGMAFLEIAAGIFLIASSIFILGNMDDNALARGIGVAMIVLSMVVGFMMAANALSKTGSTNIKIKGLWEVAAAIGILAVIAFMLGHSDWNAMIRGIGLVGLLMLELTVFVVAVNRLGGSSTIKYGGLIAISIAVGILGVIAYVLGGINPTRTRRGMAAVNGILISLGVFVVAVNRIGGKSRVSYAGLLALSIAIGILAAIAIVLSAVPTEAMNNGLNALERIVEMFGIFAVMSTMMTKVNIVSMLTTLIGIAGIFAAFVILMEFTKDIDVSRIGVISASLSALMVAFGIMNLLSGGNIASIAQNVLGFVLFVAALVAVFTALGALLEWQPQMREFINNTASLIGEFLGTVVGTFRANEMNAFNKAVGSIAGVEANEDDAKGAVAAAKVIKEFADSLPDKSIMGTLVDFITGGKLTLFSVGMENFGEGIKNFVTAISGLDINTEHVEKAKTAGTMIAELSNSFGTLTISEAIASKISEGPFVEFCKALPLFAKNLIVAYWGLRRIPDKIVDIFTRAKEAVAPIAELAQSFPEDGFFASMGDALFGTEFSHFAQDMAIFGINTKLMAKSLGQIPADIVDKVTTAKSAAEIVAKFIDSLSEMNIETKMGGLAVWFVGDNTKADSVFDAMSKIGKSMIELQDDIQGKIKPTFVMDVYTLTTIMKAIGSAMDSMNEYIDFSTVTGKIFSISDVGDELKQFYDATSGIDASKFDAIAQGFDKIVETLKTINIDDIFGNLDGDAAALKINQFVNRVRGVLDGREPDLSGATENFTASGSKIAESMVSGMKGSTGAGAAMAAICKQALDATKVFPKQFESTGRNMAIGLANGLKLGKSTVVSAALTVAKEALRTINDYLGVASPAKELVKTGWFSGMGLANGIIEAIPLVTNASEKIGSELINTTSGTLAAVSHLIDDNLDTDPVIRPVVDLTNVTESSRAISGLMNRNGAITLNTNEIRKTAASAVGSGVKNQNGSVSNTNNYSNDNSVTINGSFSVRDDMDVRSLAYEIAGIVNSQRSAAGIKSIG